MPKQTNAGKLIVSLNALRKATKSKHCLLANLECSGRAIGSHAIQNSGVIEHLQVDGHVFTFEEDPSGIKLKRKGRNRASTFTGFCAFHDNFLFNDIDFQAQNIPASFSNRQLALFYLRAIALEMWKKQNVVNTFGGIVNALQRNDFDEAGKLLKLSASEVQLAIQRPDAIIWSLEGHAKALKESYSVFEAVIRQLNIDKFHNLKFKSFELNGPAKIAVASGFSPLEDLDGRNLYNVYPARMAHAGVTVIGDQDRLHVLFAYQKRDQSILEGLFGQINDLFSNQPLFKSWLTAYILENCENIILSPNFVATLEETQIAELELAARWVSSTGQPPARNLSFSFF